MKTRIFKSSFFNIYIHFCIFIIEVMKMFRGYNLRQKEVIDIKNAQRLGFVKDVEINEENGIIEAIIVPKRDNMIGRIFGGDLVIPWNAVKVVGDEIILVSLFETELDSKFLK